MPASEQPEQPSRRIRSAQEWFFPAAALYAAVALPLSVHGMLSGRPLLPGFARSTGHAHELLFGFALAVMAGFLINRIRHDQLVLLFGGWLAARLSFLVAPDGVVALVANGAFAVAVAMLAAPQFLKAAKKLRNKLIGPLVIVVCTMLVMFHAAIFSAADDLHPLLLQQSVLLFALLMLFMGGRILAPAVAGHLQRRGVVLKARVQPRLEGALITTMLIAIAAAPVAPLRTVAGLALLAAAGTGCVRLLRWRLWKCGPRSDLLAMGAGLGWLVVGLALLAAGYLGAALPLTTGLHAVTVGALGTLTAVVMIRARLIKQRQDPASIGGALWLPVGALTAAATLRLTGASSPAALSVASLLWSAAFLGVAWMLLNSRTGSPFAETTR